MSCSTRRGALSCPSRSPFRRAGWERSSRSPSTSGSTFITSRCRHSGRTRSRARSSGRGWSSRRVCAWDWRGASAASCRGRSASSPAAARRSAGSSRTRSGPITPDGLRARRPGAARLQQRAARAAHRHRGRRVLHRYRQRLCDGCATSRSATFGSPSGIGLRIRTSWLLLRGDYGVVLDPRPGEQRGQFYISVGQAF